MQSVEVEIFGRRFRLKSDNPERTTRVADEINRQIEELNSTFDNLDFTKLLLLICLQQQEQVVLLEHVPVGDIKITYVRLDYTPSPE